MSTDIKKAAITTAEVVVGFAVIAATAYAGGALARALFKLAK